MDANKTAGEETRWQLHKSWQQHPTRHQLYGHLPPITKTIQVRRTSVLADGFSLGLNDSKSLQVSRTRLRILAVLSNAVVWIVSTRPPTFKSSRPFNNPVVTVPNAPITIGTIVTFMFHSFFNFLARSRYLSFFSLSFRFILWSELQILFLLLIIMRSGLLAGIR